MWGARSPGSVCFRSPSSYRKYFDRHSPFSSRPRVSRGSRADCAVASRKLIIGFPFDLESRNTDPSVLRNQTASSRFLQDDRVPGLPCGSFTGSFPWSRVAPGLATPSSRTPHSLSG